MKSLSAALDVLHERFVNGWPREVRVPGAISLTLALAPPSAETIVDRWDEVGAWADEWKDWAQARAGVTLETVERPTPFGRQPVPARVAFDSVDTLAAADPRDASLWSTARDRWAAMTSAGFSPHRQIRALVTLPPADFRLALGAAIFFRENPRSGLPPRAVPVEGMHTKWLARHRGVVSALLGHGAESDEPVDPDALQQSDLDVLGLIIPAPQADLLLADPDDRARVGGLRHLRAPVDELGALDLRPTRVLIVENRESALLVPDTPGLVVVHSLGNNLGALSALRWITGTGTYYWGDLDRAGFTLLSRARLLLPELESVMMDSAALERHRHLSVPDETKADPPAGNLTNEERAALRLVSGELEPPESGPGGPSRLEQERLPHAYAIAELNRVLTSALAPRVR